MRRSRHRQEDEKLDCMVEEALRGKRRFGEAAWHGILCALSGMGDVQPAPEARSLALQRMMLAAQEVREGRPATRSARHPRGFSRLAAPVAACFASLLMLFGGLTAVSQAAQPGSTLYPLKRFSERVAISSSRGWDSTAQVELSYATRRLDEVEKIKSHGPDSREEAHIPGLVEDFNTKVDDALQLAAGHEDEASEEIRAQAKELNHRLDELEPEHEHPESDAGESYDREEDFEENHTESEDEHEDAKSSSVRKSRESSDEHEDERESAAETYSERSRESSTRIPHED